MAKDPNIGLIEVFTVVRTGPNMFNIDVKLVDDGKGGPADNYVRWGPPEQPWWEKTKQLTVLGSQYSIGNIIRTPLVMFEDDKNEVPYIPPEGTVTGFMVLPFRADPTEMML